MSIPLTDNNPTVSPSQADISTNATQAKETTPTTKRSVFFYVDPSYGIVHTLNDTYDGFSIFSVSDPVLIPKPDDLTGDDWTTTGTPELLHKPSALETWRWQLTPGLKNKLNMPSTASEDFRQGLWELSQDPVQMPKLYESLASILHHTPTKKGFMTKWAASGFWVLTNKQSFDERNSFV